MKNNEIARLLGEPRAKKIEREYEVIVIPSGTKVYQGKALKSLCSNPVLIDLNLKYSEKELRESELVTKLARGLVKLSRSLDKKEEELIKKLKGTKLVVRQVSKQLCELIGCEYAQRAIIVYPNTDKKGLVKVVAFETVTVI